MLKIKTITKDEPPVKVTREIRGEEITFWLRPWTADFAQVIRKRFVKGIEWVQHPVTGRREKREIIDDDGFFDAMIDYIIAGFEGVGDETGEPWPADLEHKKALLNVAVEKGSQAVGDWVMETAQALAFTKAEQEAGEEKN